LGGFFESAPNAVTLRSARTMKQLGEPNCMPALWPKAEGIAMGAVAQILNPVVRAEDRAPNP
jgi:hypothetical protein